jgi:hypothetical protein
MERYIRWALPALGLLMVVSAQAQAPALAWERSFDGSLVGLDEAHALAVAPDNSVYVTGTSANLAPQNTCTTIHYTSDGTVLFTDHVYGAGQESTNIGRDIAIGPDGKAYVCGTTSHNNGDLALVKYGAAGRIWRKNYEQYPTAEILEEALGLVIDDSANIYMVGYITSTAGMGLENYTMKLDSAGSALWSDDFALSSADEVATCAAVAANGNVYVGGQWWDLDGENGIDMSVVRFTPGGSRIWDNAWSTIGSEDRVTDITALQNGGVAICGTSMGFSSREMTMVGYNADGSLLFNVTFTTSGLTDNEAVAIRQMGNTNVVMTGSTVQLIGGEEVSVITTDVTDLNNSFVWYQNYAGEAGLGAWPTAMTTDAQDNLYICGYMTAADGVTTDGVVLKYSSAGVLQWAIPYNGTGDHDDRFNDIALNLAGDILVCGTTHTAVNASQYLTVQYGNAVGMPEPQATLGLDAYPNPASHEVLVNGVQRSDRVEIIDAAGQLRWSGRGAVHVDISELPAGLYLVRVINEKGMRSTRLVVQR